MGHLTHVAVYRGRVTRHICRVIHMSRHIEMRRLTHVNASRHTCVMHTYTCECITPHMCDSRTNSVCVAVCCGVLQCVAVCCSVLQCVAVCCSVLQCAAVSHVVAQVNA